MSQAKHDSIHISRRAAITGAVAAAAVPIAAVGAAADADAELLELGRQFDALFPAWAVLSQRENAHMRQVREAVHAAGLDDRPRYGEPGFEEWDAAHSKIIDSVPEGGLPTEREWNAVKDPLDALAERILEQEAKTIAGLAVIARALVYREPEPYWYNIGPYDPETANSFAEFTAGDAGHCNLMNSIFALAGVRLPWEPAS
jgi:hypothetical protein